jgi:hypothetical protein
MTTKRINTFALAVSPIGAVPIKRLREIEHRRLNGSSRTKHQKVGQAIFYWAFFIE